MAKSKRMTDDQIAAAIDGQISDARLYDSNDRNKSREWALRFNEGEVDFDAMGKHRSKVVSRDVADTIGLMLPGLLRVFFASDRVAIYEPTRKFMEPEEGPDGAPLLDEEGKPKQKDISEERADQASDLVNYIVMKECGGYRQFRSAIYDGLLLGNGIIKHWWDKTPEHTTDNYTGLTADQIKMVMSDSDIVEDETETKEYPDPDWKKPELPDVPKEIRVAAAAGVPQAVAIVEAYDAAMTAPMLTDATVKRIKSKGRLRVCAMPNEEFLIDKQAVALDEDCRFAAHKQKVTRSDLIREGFSKSKVDALPLYTSTDDSAERVARADGYIVPDNAPDRATEKVDRYECYVLLDADGDGVAERYRIVMAGGLAKRHMLSKELWSDDLPFTDIVPAPRPHTWRGRSLYDEMADVQRVKTVALRGVLDNTYQQLVPQREVEAGAYQNMDEIYEPTHGGVAIRNKGFAPVTQVQIPYIADKVMPIIQYMDDIGEKRTGASQRTQALDMDALQNQSATAVNAVMAATHSKIEEFARNIAECGGLKRVFTCCYRLLVANQDRAKTIRLRGKLVDVDPRSWTADMDVTINTGLGTGSRERDMAMLGAVLREQKEAVAALGGPLNPILNISHVFDTERKMAEVAGLRSPDSYFRNLTEEDVKKLAAEQAQPKQSQPDPRIAETQAKIAAQQAEAQANLQLKQAEAQAEAQLAVAKLQSDIAAAREKAQMQLQADRERAQLELQLMRDRAAAEIQIEQEKARNSLALRREEMQLEAELTMQANATKMAMSAPRADINIEGQP